MPTGIGLFLNKSYSLSERTSHIRLTLVAETLSRRKCFCCVPIGALALKPMTIWTILIALLVGAGGGVAVTLLVVSSVRQARAAATMVTGSLPRGVVELVSLIEIPLVIIDGAGDIVAMSPSTEELGFTRNNRLSNAELKKIIERVRLTNRPVVREFSQNRGPLGGVKLDLAVRADRFGMNFVVLELADKTAVRRLDEVRRDFVANISHELKTPIGAITLLAEALQQAADDEDTVRHFADRLADEADRLATLTREIIELSRLQAEEGIEAFQLVDINDVVAQAVDHNQVSAVSRNLDIVVANSSKATVRGDSARLVMAVSNLITNAITYSVPPARIGVSVGRTGQFVEITVTDTGIGMTREESERVFERFYRTDQARSRTTGGTGLGLSIVKHVVSNHGGDIRVWSRPNKGSTFTLRLPFAKQETEEKAA